MHLSKRFFIFLVFSTSSCYSRIIIKTWEPDDSGLVEATVKILETCYGNRVSAVGLAGNLTGPIVRSMWRRKNSPVTLIDATARIVNNGPVNPSSRQKLQVFVISASYATILKSILERIKASVWWNHMATFLILDWPPSNHGCSNAFEILWTAWEMNILDGIFVCNRRAEGRLFYTFNPYTSKASYPWRVDKIYSGNNNHPWTMFARGYEDHQEICKELNFDKTNDLGGYEMRITTIIAIDEQDIIAPGKICPNRFEDIYCQLSLSALNATPKVLTYDLTKSLGYVDDKGIPHGSLAEVYNGLSDVCFTIRHLTSMKGLTTSYPHWQSELLIITQYRGFKSQLSKICSILDRSSRIGLCLVCLINILLFKYFLRQTGMSSYLNTLRIICNSSLTKIPDNLGPRIYLGCLFLFALTMQGIFQGQLASLLTNQVPLKNVDTLNDLVELGHTIYGYKPYLLYINEPKAAKRLVGMTIPSCMKEVLEDSTNACVNDKNLIFYNAARYKLHLSRESIVKVHTTFPIRRDWPVEKRFNRILQRFVESHILQIIYQKITEKELRAIEAQENINKEQSYNILNLEQLNFAFVILGIGLVFATVSFVIEIIIG